MIKVMENEILMTILRWNFTIHIKFKLLIHFPSNQEKNKKLITWQKTANKIKTLKQLCTQMSN